MKRLAVMSFVFALVAIVANTSWAQHHHHYDDHHHHQGGFVVGSGGGISIGIGNFGGYGGYGGGYGGGYNGYGGYGYSNYNRPVYNSGYYQPNPHYDLHVPTYYGGRSGCGGGSIYYRW